MAQLWPEIDVLIRWATRQYLFVFLAKPDSDLLRSQEPKFIAAELDPAHRRRRTILSQSWAVVSAQLPFNFFR
jgi:hypothetical protein